MVFEDSKAEGIYTSGTRIYKAYNVKDTKEEQPLIIKDYWPDEAHDSEAMILKKISKDITDKKDKIIFDHCTLTVIASEKVKVGRNFDHTRKTILHRNVPKGKYNLKLPNEEVGQKRKSKTLGSKGWQTSKFPVREMLKALRANQSTGHVFRWHYRIVYGELAQPYYELRNYKDILLVLGDSIKGRCLPYPIQS